MKFLRIAINRNFTWFSPLCQGCWHFTEGKWKQKPNHNLCNVLSVPPQFFWQDQRSISGLHFSCLQETTEWDCVLRVGSRKSAENYFLTLPEGGFSALKQQQSPISSLPVSGDHRAQHLLLHHSCNSLLKEGSAPSFWWTSFTTWDSLHLSTFPSAISVSGDELSLVKPKHMSWGRLWIVGWASVLWLSHSSFSSELIKAAFGGLLSVKHFPKCSHWICSEVMTGFRKKGREETI